MTKNSTWTMLALTCYAYKHKDEEPTRKRYDYSKGIGVYVNENRFCTATNCINLKCPLHEQSVVPEKMESEK